LLFILAFSLCIGGVSAAETDSNSPAISAQNNDNTQESIPQQSNEPNTLASCSETTSPEETNPNDGSNSANNMAVTASSSSTQGSSDISALVAVNNTTKTPEIIITFDDSYESAYTVAYPIMQQYGIKGTVYIVPAWIGAPGHLTVEELITLHNAGWTIADHTWDHPVLTENLTNEQITTEIQKAIDWLNENGFEDGAYHLAYPYGAYNDTVLQVCNELGIKTARTVNWGAISPDGYLLPYGGTLDYLQLPTILFRNDTTTNDWKGTVDETIALKETTIILLHDIVTSNPEILEDVTESTFREFIEYIAQTGVKTQTINGWYNEVTDNIAPTVNATPAGGLYNTTQNVILAANEAATIYYTTNGSTPTTSSSKYTNPIIISMTTILKFFAVDNAGNPSSIYTEEYTIDTIAPTANANPAGRDYYSPQNVVLAASEISSIYYTLDGTDPTTSSSKYKGPVNIGTSKTLKFRAIDEAGNSSPIYTENYRIYKSEPYCYAVSVPYRQVWYKVSYKKWYKYKGKWRYKTVYFKVKQWKKKWYKYKGKWKYKWRYTWVNKWASYWLWKNETRWNTKNVLT
jgi:peptidoglycan/xylan/chitin deacetylase (PgdA/CDA1 family)